MKTVLFTLCLFLTSLGIAQENFIRGKLLDATTDEPIAFATVRVKGKSKGVISNQDGSFRIPEIFKEYGDTLEISSMGYQEMERRISDLSPGYINILRLNPGVFELREAVVSFKKKRDLSAKQIIRRAIRNIPENYPLYPFSTIGYYRDYQRDDQQYVNLNEAILEVFDQGFNTSDSLETKVKLYDYSRNTDFEQDSLASISYDYKNFEKTIDDAFLSDYGGNEFTILRVHDAIRNFDVNTYSFVNRFDRDLLRHHKFTKEADTYWNGENLYTIDFTKTFSEYRAKGTLYIGKPDFAIVKLEYAVHGKDRFDKSERNKTPDKERELIFKIDTEYQRANNQLYLNYISFQNTFRIRLPPLFQVKDVVADTRQQVFIVHFNNVIDASTARSLKNYNFEFRGNKVIFRKVSVKEDKVFLYPLNTNKDREKMFAEINEMSQKYKKSQIQDRISKILETKIEDVKDLDGNLVNEIRYKDYNQFREFFVQQLKTRTALPSDTFFMKKNSPIFGDQPIAKPENFDQYWMNTPLQDTPK